MNPYLFDRLARQHLEALRQEASKSHFSPRFRSQLAHLLQAWALRLEPEPRQEPKHIFR